MRLKLFCVLSSSMLQSRRQVDFLPANVKYPFLRLYLLLFTTNSIFYIVSYHEIGNWLHNLQAAPPSKKKTKIKKSLFLLGNQLVNNLTLELQLTEESRNV